MVRSEGTTRVPLDQAAGFAAFPDGSAVNPTEGDVPAASPPPRPRPVRDPGRRRMRPMRTIHQPGQLLSQIPAYPPMHRRPVHPDAGSDFRDIRTRQNGANRVQALLNHRQDNQSQSRPPRSTDAPRRRRGTRCRNRPLLQITWRTRVAHQSTEDSADPAIAVRGTVSTAVV
jgi:hypothetical protein